MLRDINGNRLPDFLIVGAAKSGTTSLYHYLRQHAGIFMPEKKEPHYLGISKVPAAAGAGEYSIGTQVRTYEDYLELFRSAGKNVRAGEASVSYLPLAAESIERIKEIYADHRKLRIIAILRDPADRAVSHYSMKVRDGKEHMSLKQAVSPRVIQRRMASGYDITWDYLRLGLYSESLRQYMQAFDNVLVLDYGEFASDTAAVLHRVFEFLDVDTSQLPPVAGRRYNASGVPRHPVLKPLAYLAYHDNPAKALLARVLPKPVKVALLNRAGSLLLRRTQPDPAVVRELRQFYAEDQEHLRELSRQWRGLEKVA